MAAGVCVSPGSCCLSTDGLGVRIRTRSDRRKVKMGERRKRVGVGGRAWLVSSLSGPTVGKKEGGRTHLEVAIKRGPGSGGAWQHRHHWLGAADYGRR